MVFYRSLVYFFKSGSVNFGDAYYRKTIIVGEGEEAARVLNLLEKSGARNRFIGFVNSGNQVQESDVYLGNTSALAEIVKIFKVDEIIFCSKNLPAQKIIDWMGSIQQPDLHFKIVPEESLFIIGSDSKDAPGDFYTIDISLSLGEPTEHTQETFVRYFHQFVPSCFFSGNRISKNPVGYFSVLQVLSGNKTWVGYAVANNISLLPKIKSGVLSPVDELGS